MLYLDEKDLDNMLYDKTYELQNQKGKTVNKSHIEKMLNLVDNVRDLKYYEMLNLMWKVKYDEIPN